MIRTDLAFGPRYMVLNLGKNEYGLQFNLVFFIKLLGNDLDPNLARLNEASTRWVWASIKKTYLSNRPGSVKKKKNWPVAIPD